MNKESTANAGKDLPLERLKELYVEPNKYGMYYYFFSYDLGIVKLERKDIDYRIRVAYIMFESTYGIRYIQSDNSDIYPVIYIGRLQSNQNGYEIDQTGIYRNFHGERAYEARQIDGDMVFVHDTSLYWHELGLTQNLHKYHEFRQKDESGG